MLTLLPPPTAADTQARTKNRSPRAAVLPHQTREGPNSPFAWRKLLATAPRACDSAGRVIIQVCTADDQRPIFASLAYAQWRAQRQPAIQQRKAGGHA